MKCPCLDIALDKIEENCRTVTRLCSEHGIEVAGVTKLVRGSPRVARALLRAGVEQLADSRLDNIRRLRESGIGAPVLLLRIPMLSEVEQVVELADISLNSELAVAEALSGAAQRAGKRHRVVMMIDLGDLREGVLPDDAITFAESITRFRGLELYGVGANFGCFGGIRPTRKNLGLLVQIAQEIRQRLSVPLPVVSGGNTASLNLLEPGDMPQGVNHLRLGISILMGDPETPEGMTSMLQSRLHDDTFRLHAEVIELKEKPSVPHGERGKDAFGREPVFEDRGNVRRAILAVGRQDVVPEWIHPLDEGAVILGASSDHLLVDVTRTSREITVGSQLTFRLKYGAVLAAMTSPYVHKNFIGGAEDGTGRRAAGCRSTA